MLTGNIAGGSRPDVMCPLLALVSLASLVGCALLVTDFSSLQRVDQLPRTTLCKKRILWKPLRAQSCVHPGYYFRKRNFL